MRCGFFGVLGVLLAWSSATVVGQDPAQRPTFRAAVSRVAVTATVRDSHGRPVTDLTSQDFQLKDSGKEREIVEFRSEDTPVSIALLVDSSGSMDVAEKREAMREVTRHLLSWMAAGRDQVGLFSFDQYLQEQQPFAPAPAQVLEKLETIRPFGKTKLFDAIAETGRRVAAAGGTRRAVVVLTDGADNASLMTPGQVSSQASAIDVPVYIIIVVSPLDRAETSVVDEQKLASLLEGRLADLARWTGGEIFAAIGPAHTSIAARQIVSELRHQYLIVFEPSSQSGWHPIDLRIRDQEDLVVRARSGYVVRSGPEKAIAHF